MTASEDYYELGQRDGKLVRRRVQSTIGDWEPIDDENMQVSLTEMDRRILHNLGKEPRNVS